MIEFACDGCGKSFRVDDAMAGKQGKCRRCGAVARIPGAPATVADLDVGPRDGPWGEPEAAAWGDDTFPIDFFAPDPPAAGPAAQVPVPADTGPCPGCGARQAPAVAPNDRNRLAAAVLALSVGGFGMHKFYLGEPGWGIAYLVTCWTFIPGITAFFEAIALLHMSGRDFDRKYGTT